MFRVHLRWWATIASVLTISLTGRVQAQPATAPDYVAGDAGYEALFTLFVALPQLVHLAPFNDTGWAPWESRPADDGYDLASDFTGNYTGASWQLVVGWGLESGYYDRHGASDAMPLALRSTLIELQAFSIGTSVGAAIKHLSGRCRPRDWDARAETCREGAVRDAFPSGHVIAPASIAGARITLALRSETLAPQRWVSFGLAEGAAVVTSALRVLAGAHSPGDVAAGMLIGHAAGVVASFAHPVMRAPTVQGVAEQRSLPQQSPTMLKWRGRF